MFQGAVLGLGHFSDFKSSVTRNFILKSFPFLSKHRQCQLGTVHGAWPTKPSCPPCRKALSSPSRRGRARGSGPGRPAASITREPGFKLRTFAQQSLCGIFTRLCISEILLTPVTSLPSP